MCAQTDVFDEIVRDVRSLKLARACLLATSGDETASSHEYHLVDSQCHNEFQLCVRTFTCTFPVDIYCLC